MATPQPTAQDQYMLELLNRARMNPQAEANRLLGGNLNEGLAKGKISTTAKQPLAFNLKLFQSAKSHSQWMLDTDKFSHAGSDGTRSDTRATLVGYDWSYIGENIGRKGTTGILDVDAYVAELYDELFIDKGIDDRGHRVNILDNDFREVGISSLVGIFTKNGKDFDTVMNTQNFGSDKNPNAFLTGVAYTDLVKDDNFYTIGEGLGNIRITAVGSNGKTFTTTSMTAGGYSLRLAAGTYSVTFSGDFNNDGESEITIAKTIKIGTQNIKLDFASDTYVAPTPTDGDDTLLGTSKDDTIESLGGKDRLSGMGGNDSLQGQAGEDTLDGGDGNDILNGGNGKDTMIGGKGNDTYIVDNTGDKVQETSTGTDTVESSITYSLGTNLEHLTLTGTAAINGTGNSLNNTIVGNSANNILSGGAGNDRLNGAEGQDRMTGGTGNDTYIIDHLGDVVVEQANEGIDSVQSSITYSLGANVEQLILTGIEAINGTGNTLNNTIVGNSANNILNGGAGTDTLSGDAGDDTLNGGTGNDTLNGGDGNDNLNGGSGVDRMTGGSGNDIYLVDNTGDIISEVSTDPTEVDNVLASISYTLVINVENLTLTGTAGISGQGNILNNIIIGNSGANNLYGGAGDDTLTGGGGSDRFQFRSTTEGIDTITDLVSGTDKIEISASGFGGGLVAGLLSNAQLAIVSEEAVATEASQRFLYNSTTGALFFDADGNGEGAAVQFATLSSPTTLVAGDFVMVA
jgi:Ca2+-binding RTX toxin-like protein